MDKFTQLSQINEQNAHKAAEDAKHHDLVDVNLKTQQVILQSFSSFIDYLDNKVTKAEVINQLENIGTPDVAYVVSALKGIDERLATFKNVDLSEITSVMREVLAEAQKLPKVLPDLPEQIDYTKQFQALADTVNAVKEVIKAQELHVDAPIVNVPETQVTVDAPDLSPLEKHLKDVTKAVKGIVIPEFKTDNKEVEKQLEKANKTLLKILDRPVSGGGGGGGTLPFLNSSGEVTHVTLTAQGKLPVDASLSSSATTAGTTSVANAITSTQLLAANISRKAASIYNDDSTANLFLKYGTAASSTSFKIKIAPGGYYEFAQPVYTGVVHGAASAASGSARISEEY